MSFENSLMATVLGFHSSIISFELARRGVWRGAAKASGSGGVTRVWARYIHGRSDLDPRERGTFTRSTLC